VQVRAHTIFTIPKILRNTAARRNLEVVFSCNSHSLNSVSCK